MILLNLHKGNSLQKESYKKSNDAFPSVFHKEKYHQRLRALK